MRRGCQVKVLDQSSSGGGVGGVSVEVSGGDSGGSPGDASGTASGATGSGSLEPSLSVDELGEVDMRI